MPRATLPTIVLIAAISLVGCTSAAPAPTTSASPGESGAASATPSTAPSTPAEAWRPAGTAVDTAGYVGGDGGVVFSSPSGNLRCGYSEYPNTTPWWWCMLEEQSVVLPSDPHGKCPEAVAPNGLGVLADDPAAVAESFCADAAESPALPYGSSISYRDMGCDSTEDGMTCRSLVTGAGFRLSRSDYELF
ncbi:DUF6636 domain-containing protein [Protaetiibacter mangrovi]|uniref:Uncharacterized protein n=1 Tax=Protaetiibacter mangrovi TaxID=2970926 RepID=A0ABT1ZIN5_9MICO|nr:DUF6636 domain-containing protein [Protaetiibacter mangrovi]MCS0500440.1 hypothetical protein [Protaetiibacter mangrovi]